MLVILTNVAKLTKYLTKINFLYIFIVYDIVSIPFSKAEVCFLLPVTLFFPSFSSVVIHFLSNTILQTTICVNQKPPCLGHTCDFTAVWQYFQSFTLHLFFLLPLWPSMVAKQPHVLAQAAGCLHKELLCPPWFKVSLKNVSMT